MTLEFTTPSLESVTAALLEQDIRLTKSRKALLAAIFRQDERHLSVDNIIALRPGCSQATIYNNLPVFVQAGVARVITTPARDIYDFAPTNKTHAHFLHPNGSVTDVPDDEILISKIPDIPDGCQLAGMDVLIHLRSKA